MHTDSDPSTARDGVYPPLEFLTDIGNMLKAFIGINFLYISYAFSKAGLTRAIPSLLFITFLTEHCCLLLVRVKRAMKSPNTVSDHYTPLSTTDQSQQEQQPQQQSNSQNDQPPTYGDIARYVGGKHMENLINFALVITQFGYCVGYLIFLSSTIHHMLPSDLQSTIPVSLLVIIPVPILFTLSMLSSIRLLGPFSLAANLALLIGFISVVVFLAQHYKWAPVEPSIFSFPLFFGQVTAALEGIGLVVPVETSMRTKSRFHVVLRVSLVILTAVLMIVGVMGFVTFGDKTSSILLTNFGKTPVVAVVKVVLIIGILFTYPLQIVPVIQFLEMILLGSMGGTDYTANEDSTLETELQPSQQEESRIDSSERTVDETGQQTQAPDMFVRNRWRIGIRFFVIGATAMIAMLAGKSFGLVQSLVGSLGASCLAYTAPALFHYRIFGREAGVWVRMKDLAIVVFGLLGAVVGTVTTIVAFRTDAEKTA